MKSSLAVLYAAIFILLSAAMAIASTGIASFNNSQNNEFSVTSAVGAAGSTAAVEFEQTGSNLNGSGPVAGSAPSPVPEPATMLLVGTGLIAIAGIGRKKLVKKKDRDSL